MKKKRRRTTSNRDDIKYIHERSIYCLCVWNVVVVCRQKASLSESVVFDEQAGEHAYQNVSIHVRSMYSRHIQSNDVEGINGFKWITLIERLSEIDRMTLVLTYTFSSVANFFSIILAWLLLAFILSSSLNRKKKSIPVQRKSERETLRTIECYWEREREKHASTKEFQFFFFLEKKNTEKKHHITQYLIYWRFQKVTAYGRWYYFHVLMYKSA